MKRQRKGELETFVCELVNSRSQSHGRHRDVASRHTQAFRLRSQHGAYRSHEAVVIRQGFAHAHKDNIVHAFWLAFSILIACISTLTTEFTGSNDGIGADNLVHDLSRRHVACESGLACCTERAVHATTSLGGNTKSNATGVTHEDGLDQCTVE